jgi:hypothetical protein
MPIFLLLSPGPPRRRRSNPAAPQTACASEASMPQSAGVGDQTVACQASLRTDADPAVVDGRDGELDRVAGLIG